MNRNMHWKTPSLVACVVFLALGCGQAPGTFIILQSQAPTPECGATADVTAAYVGDGRLDVSIVTPTADSAFILFPLLENDLPGRNAGQTIDGNRIALSGFDVELTIPPNAMAPAETVALFQDAGRQSLLHFHEPFSGNVDSGGGHTATRVRAVQTDLALDLVANGNLKDSVVPVDIAIRARGNTLNSSVVSDTFHFPITICNGCLRHDLGLCTAATTAINTGNPCNPAQDAVVDCCTTNAKLQCPARATP